MFNWAWQFLLLFFLFFLFSIWLIRSHQWTLFWTIVLWLCVIILISRHFPFILTNIQFVWGWALVCWWVSSLLWSLSSWCISIKMTAASYHVYYQFITLNKTVHQMCQVSIYVWMNCGKRMMNNSPDWLNLDFFKRIFSSMFVNINACEFYVLHTVHTELFYLLTKPLTMKLSLILFSSITPECYLYWDLSSGIIMLWFTVTVYISAGLTFLTTGSINISLMS